MADHDDVALLLRGNAVLREDLRLARAEIADLRVQLAAATREREANRESRRAALNLMEDAVLAREAARSENAERQRVEERLREADRRKDEFLATLAHELRAPLAPIRYALRTLGEPMDANASDQLHAMMTRQVTHMARLIDDLIEVSRITRGAIELRRERMPLSDAVERAIETSGVHLWGHRFELTMPDEPLFLDADAVRVAQVITNLLGNAIKFTPTGGRIELVAERQGDRAILRVRDDGIGIAPEALPRMFELFTQAGGQRHAGMSDGLGIGLPLARRLVELHGGELHGTSDGLGRGAEFVVSLPLVAGPAVPEAPRPAEAPLAMRVLVVDDDVTTADSLGTLLSMQGADVTLANDGASALIAVEATGPDVVLLDIGMPDMDGYEVARRIREGTAAKAPLLVAISGWGQPEDRRRSQAAGIDHHLVKPVDPSALNTLLAAFQAANAARTTTGSATARFNEN